MVGMLKALGLWMLHGLPVYELVREISVRNDIDIIDFVLGLDASFGSYQL